MKAFHFLDAKDIGILFVVHDEVQQHQGLIKGDQAFGGFRANAIDDVALQSKQFGKNSDDNGGLSIFGEAKNNAAGFMDQNFQSLRSSESGIAMMFLSILHSFKKRLPASGFILVFLTQHYLGFVFVQSK